MTEGDFGDGGSAEIAAPAAMEKHVRLSCPVIATRQFWPLETDVARYAAVPPTSHLTPRAAHVLLREHHRLRNQDIGNLLRESGGRSYGESIRARGAQYERRRQGQEVLRAALRLEVRRRRDGAERSIHHDQAGGGYRRRYAEASDARRTFDVAGLCCGGRCGR